MLLHGENGETSYKSKRKKKIKERKRSRFFDSISRRCLDRLITRNGGRRARDVGSGGDVDSGRVAVSERRGEDLVIPKGERDSPVSSHHSDALYLLCHPFVIVLDERDASLAATDFLIDPGYSLHTRIFPFDFRRSWYTIPLDKRINQYSKCIQLLMLEDG